MFDLKQEIILGFRVDKYMYNEPTIKIHST